MKAKIVTVYSCDHCKKKLFREHAMKNHEAGCDKNPANKKACFDCVHLTTEEVEIFDGCDYDGEPNTRNSGCFSCVKLKKLMYSFKAEKLGLPDKYPEDFEDQQKMPNTCRHMESYDKSKYENIDSMLPF